MFFAKSRLSRYLKRLATFGIISCSLVCNSRVAFAQSPAPGKVLTLAGQKTGARDLPQDQGANGVWQRLLKLKTTASVLHTQAHPDDEHADLLTYLSRGNGVRTALLSLNRGESGANVLGPELFDQLGLLRTEEFLLAAAYYGLDDLYFTKLADYGYSKRVEEAYQKWGKENVLREMVRVIRLNRPLVIISRFHGSARDGHGNHQAAGELTPVAWQLAGDSTAFPELIAEGLRPWKAMKLYRGGIRPANNEPWQVEVNTGEYSPWLGQSYKNFSLLGYSMHRSQVGGNRNVVNGPFKIYYERIGMSGKTGEKESGFFDGIDTTLTGIFSITGEKAPEGVMQLLTGIAADVATAIQLFQLQNPAAVVPHLTTGLAKTRAAIRLLNHQPEAVFMLQLKEQQFMDAINAALGLTVQALAVPSGSKEARSVFEPAPVMGFAVAGKPFDVKVVLLHNSPLSIEPQNVNLVAPAGWEIRSQPPEVKSLTIDNKLEQSFTVTLPNDAAFSNPYFSRASIQDSEYQSLRKESENLPANGADLQVLVSYVINGETVKIVRPVQVRQAALPFGYNHYTLKVAPAIGVNLKPRLGVVSVHSGQKSLQLAVELVNNFDSVIRGILVLKLPPGWKAQPAQASFSFAKAGEKKPFTFTVAVPAMAQKEFKIEAVATANGTAFTQGYDVISYRDLDHSVVHYPATTVVKGLDVKMAKGLRIGYVMGAGDEVPATLQQMGAQVQLLTAADLAAGKFDLFDAVIIGIRAYAVRPDLNTYNQSLLGYAKGGGHLIVLYQTPEFVPGQMAPYPAILPGNAEEVSEEDAPMKFLAAAHPVLHFPNKITTADFENWVEQRGSKFFSEWDKAYVPIVSSNVAGQPPQNGGWLMARWGTGHYTYFAYALHRQLPYGVPGAYRLLANLVSYARKKPV